jgi:hypothetical protein
MGSEIETWFWDFLERHLERIPRGDWPPIGSEFWETHLRAFEKHGVSDAVAEDASKILAESPPPYIDRHLETFLRAVRSVWAASEVASTAPAEREAAERFSRTCDDCGGKTGIAVRYRRKSLGQVDSKGRPVIPAVQFYCRCSMGRWLQKHHQQHAPEIHALFLDLQKYPDLWGYEYRRPADAEPAVEPPCGGREVDSCH